MTVRKSQSEGPATSLDQHAEIAPRIRRRVLNALHLGRLRPGDRLPSARDIAAEFGVDQRTALSAYKELVIEGIVELRPRSGMYVAEISDRSRARLTELARWATEVFVQGTERDVAPIDLPSRMRHCIDGLRLRSACVECNADQIHSLCAELSADYGLTAIPIDLRDLAEDERLGELREVDLIVTTMYHSSEVQRFARRAGKPVIAISLRSDLVNEFLADLAKGPTYFVATDVRFEAKLHEVFKDTPGATNLRTAIVGRDDVDAIPIDAATHLMRTVREILPDSDLVRRSPPPGRILSTVSVREILTFIINANLHAMASRERDNHT